MIAARRSTTVLTAVSRSFARASSHEKNPKHAHLNSMDLATALANTDLVWWPTVIRSFDVGTPRDDHNFTTSLLNLRTALADELQD
jgi:hypothetical protein